MKNKQNFNILIIELGVNKSNILFTTLSRLDYRCYVADTLPLSYDILRMEAIDLVIVNGTNASDAEKYVIMDIQNLTDCGIIFLTADPDTLKMEEFSRYNLLSYNIKLGNLLNIVKEIDNLIAKLISNSLETILLIKGKNETRDLIAELLRLRRYNVVICPTGASAWKKIDTLNQLSLILVDINIADMDSMDILRKARKKFSNILPVISVSKHYDSLILQQNIANGLSDFIKSPIEKLDFGLRIDLWIDNVKQKREIEEQKKEIESVLGSFRALANATMEALLMFENNICVDANDEAIRMFEYQMKSQILGIHILDFVPKTLPKYDKEELLKNEVNHEFEIDMMKNDEIIFPAQIKERNIRLENRDLKIIAILDLTEIKRNEDILHQQSKMASMGEMIENIAHQWRQPLSAITISASSILVSHEIGMVDEEETHEQLEVIIESAEFLSHTINDFQNFLKENKQIIKFKLHDVVSKVLKLVDGNMKNNQIFVLLDLDENINMNGLENELMQVVLNIINNAKDILVEKIPSLTDRIIFIKAYLDESKENGIIEIQDSAGGVPKNIISKIFEPYFTTKHQTQGTGLGLYMTHKMITEHMGGDIKVTNKSFSHQTKEYKGANFQVIVPIEISQSKS
ncbi:MAG: ATP-binding protein [Arcobacteraceae bacterium]|jgi:signal transduction histidine kinase|nr:ATP-binding protein [Arcobacteraceae bacterium]